MLDCGNRDRRIYHMVSCDTLQHMLDQEYLSSEGENFVGPAYNPFAYLVQIEVVHLCLLQVLAKGGSKAFLNLPWFTNNASYIP